MALRTKLKIVVDGVLVGEKNSARGYSGAIVGIQERECWHRSKEEEGAQWGKRVRGKVKIYVVCRWIKKGDKKLQKRIKAIQERNTMQDVRFMEAKSA